MQQHITCHHCHAPIRTDTSVCPHCQAVIQPTDDYPQPGVDGKKVITYTLSVIVILFGIMMLLVSGVSFALLVVGGVISLPVVRDAIQHRLPAINNLLINVVAVTLALAGTVLALVLQINS